ncbi:MAG: carbohydrate ABC transporter permease [Lachnospiraceae bacterium]|nr:carbohydrate ABC transporter permease [Lachnospiraceae bacterium]
MSRKAKKKLGRVVLYILVILIVIITVAPFAWMVISSLSTKQELLQRPLHWIPQNPTLDNYKAMLAGTSGKTTDAASQFLSSFKNSLEVTAIVTVISLAVGLIAAYSFSRFRFRGHDTLMNSILFTQMIPAVAIIIPMYSILTNMGLINTKAGLVITYLSFVLPYMIWLMKGYIDGIPIDLEEAAMVDGCSRLRAFFIIVLPVAATGLAATVIFAFILSWNEFFFALNFTSTAASKTLPVLLTDFSSKFGANYILACTAGVLASLPPVLIALIFQRFIISGLSQGAVKG